MKKFNFCKRPFNRKLAFYSAELEISMGRFVNIGVLSLTFGKYEVIDYTKIKEPAKYLKDIAVYILDNYKNE